MGVVAGVVGAVGVEADVGKTVGCVALRGRSVIPLRERKERKDRENGHQEQREGAGAAGAAGRKEQENKKSAGGGGGIHA